MCRRKKENSQESDLTRSHIEEVTNALLKAVDAKDSYTFNHSRRVAAYSELLALSIGLPQQEVEKIKLAAVLHDIGKIGMKDNILSKSSGLDDMEYIEAKEHVVIGARIASNLEYLHDVTPLILHHHERYDGEGYPERLKGENIPLGSRIIAICDSYDAMTSDREYRKALPEDVALERIMQGIGERYDPKLCVTFVKLLREKPSLFRLDLK